MPVETHVPALAVLALRAKRAIPLDFVGGRSSVGRPGTRHGKELLRAAVWVARHWHRLTRSFTHQLSTWFFSGGRGPRQPPPPPHGFA